MNYTDDENKLPESVIRKVEKDLRCYPDWIVRIETGGLGSPSFYGREVSGGYSDCSSVEYEAELSEENRRKVDIIEKVYDRLHGKTKDIIDLRYFQDYGRHEILNMLHITKRKYYTLRDRALESFARSMGHIE